MKKRVVSLLLLLAMLITAIPVMTASAVAAEATAPQTEEERITYVDLHTLYAQNGLKSLFSVFGDADGVDLAAGTWTSKVGKGVATIGNKQYWERGENGSLGFNMYFGTYINGQYDARAVYRTNADGSYVVNQYGSKIFSHYEHTNYHDYGTRLDLGIDLLPADDFTVEYLAQYKPYYVTDGEGNTVLDANGKPIETYNVSPDHKMPLQDPGSSLNRSVVRMGYLQAFTYAYDGAWENNSSNKRGSGTQWRISGSATWPKSNSADNIGHFFVLNEGIRTYAITRAEDANNVYAAYYAFYKDSALFTDADYDGSAVRPNVNGYVPADFSVAEKDLTGETDPKYFWLSERHGTDFYSVRIYDRALTAEELAQNRLVDFMLYYGVKLPVDGVNDLIFSRITKLMNEVGFVTDNYEDVKENVVKKVSDFVEHEKIAAMYAQREHLTAFFSALDTDTVTLSGGAGTWQSLVGTEQARFSVCKTVNAKWVQDGKRVGITHFYGQLGADKVTLTTSGVTTNTVGGSAHLASRLDLGLSLLPKEDFTIDYVAQYNPIYVATTGGEVATFTEEYVAAKSLSTSLIGTPMEYFLATGNGVPSAQYQGNYDFIGFIASRPVVLDGTHSHHGRGNVCWTLSDNNHKWDASCDWVGGSAFNGVGLRGDYGSRNIREVGATRNYAIMRDETLTVAEDGARTVTAVYSLWKNGAIPNGGYKSPVLSTANTAAGMYYWDKDDTGNFYLAAANSIDFYTLRIYDTTLTGAEMDHNRAMDVIRYYELDLSPIEGDDAYFAELCDLALTKDLVEEGLDWEAIRAELQDFIKKCAKAKEVRENYELRYAASNHLKAIFTTFAPFTVNLTAGTWTDLVSGATATLGNKTYWRVDETSGAVGFNTFYGQFTNGEFVATTSLGSNANTAVNTGTRLEFNISLLPQEDFTVEYTAMYKPVYVYDASEADLIAKEGETKLESYSYSRGDYGSIWDNISVDNLGWFQSVTTGLDTNANYGNFVSQTSYKTEEGQNLTRGSLHWVFGQQNGGSSGWYTAAQAFWMGKSRLVTDGLNIVGDVYQTNNAIRTYTISVDESVTRAGYTTALFSLYRDVDFYNSNEAVGELNTSEKGYADGGYYDIATPYSSACRFWLSAMRPTDFFTVRVYDKALTGMEMARNRFADLVYYYELSVDDTVWYDEVRLTALINAFGDAPFAMGDAKKTQKDALQTAINEFLKEEYEDNDYAALYVREGLVGLFTDFTEDDGADVANGTWKNQVYGSGDATFRGTKWENREKGVGYTTHHSNWSNGTEHRAMGLSLPAHYEDLDNFTVEAFATVVGPTDDNGDRWVTSGQSFVSLSSAFRFGMLQALFFGNVTATGGSFSLRWNLWQVAWQGSAPAYYGNVGKTLGADDAGWRNMGDAMVPTAGVMQITKSTARTDGAITDVAYNIAYNNAAGSTFSVAKGSYTLEDYIIWENAYTPAQIASPSYEVSGRFSLFNGMPATVYAIRVYDRALTSAEKAQNRLADLLYYHDVNISGKAIAYLLENPQALANLANVAAGIKISEADMEANKTTLENALDIKQVVVEKSDGSSDTMDFVGDHLILPKKTGDKQVAAWVVGSAKEAHVPGSAISVEAGATIKAILADAPATAPNVSIKMTKAEENIAMRFTATVSRGDFEAIAAAYGREKLTVGILITPASYVEMAGGVFTREALRRMVDAYSSIENAPAFIDVKSYGGFYATDETTMTIAGSIYRFSEVTRRYNPAFAAIGYIDVDVDGDLARDFTLYGAYNPNANHKVMDAFSAARNYMTDTQKKWIDSLIKSFGG